MILVSDEIVSELREIKKLLEPKTPPPPPKPKHVAEEFKFFLKNYKVMGLAVAFIMGLYLGMLVQSLVKDLVLPLIGLAVPGLADLASFVVPVGTQNFGIGSFLAAVITFVCVAFVIFLLVKITKRFGID